MSFQMVYGFGATVNEAQVTQETFEVTEDEATKTVTTDRAVLLVHVIRKEMVDGQEVEVRTSVQLDGRGDLALAMAATKPGDTVFFEGWIAAIPGFERQGIYVARVDLRANAFTIVGAAAHLLRAVIVGNLGRDPEMRYTPTAVPVTSMSVATNTYMGKNVPDVVIWFRTTLWRRWAEIAAAQLKKGRPIAVTGTLTVNGYQNKKTYLPAGSAELNAKKFNFINGSGNGSGEAAPPPAEVVEPGRSDDMPW